MVAQWRVLLKRFRIEPIQAGRFSGEQATDHLDISRNPHLALQFEQLGPYRIGRQLGRGGMGTVFAAVQIESGMAAAVKVLSAALAQEEGFRARFESEIETLRMLRHPNIVRLFGFGEHEGHLFYAMELVDGGA